MKTPTCCVVVPTYNRARFIGRCLESIVESGLPGVQVIVVDDGSTDGTPEVVKAVPGPIRYVRQKNAGLQAARNTGISLCDSETVAFLDDDDQYIAGAHLRMLGFLGEHPEVGFVFGDVLVNDRQPEFHRGHRWPVYDPLRTMPGHRDGAFRILDRMAFLNYLLLERNCVLAQATITRRMAIDTAGMFNESLGAYEEWEFFARLASVAQCAYFDEACVVIEKHHSNMSSDLEMMVGNAVEVRRMFLEGAYPVDAATRVRLERLWAETWFDWVMHAFRRNDVREARHRLKGFVRQFGVDTRALTYLGLTYLPPSILDGLTSIRRRVSWGVRESGGEG